MPGEIRVPEMGESILEATVGKWYKKEGDPVSAGEALVELETDKVNQDLTAEQAGVLSQILHKQGDNVPVGTVLGVVASAGAVAVPAAAAKPAANGEKAAAAAAAPSATIAAPPATPVAARTAEARGVDIAGVPGSGRGGKVTQGDVLEHATRAPQAPAAAPAAAALPAPAPRGARTLDPRGEEVRPMSRVRRTIAENLVRAKQQTAMLTTFNEIDMGAVMDLRKRRQEEFQKRNGVRLGFMSFFTKASVGGLKAFPLINAEIDGTDIIVKNYFDIGMAVGTDQGLLVPVIRDADKKSFADIEKTVGALAEKARTKKLTLDDLRGGSFTITNGGVYGSLNSTPILNYPQVGILGLHKIQDRPMVVGGQVVVRPMMYVAVSYDHRIVDGADAVRFLVRIKELMEEPEQLLLEG